MPCRTVSLPEGGYAIICGRGSRPKPCSICGRPHRKLCDFPLTGEKDGKTCDRPLCERCAVHPDPAKDLDYCPAHARLMEKGDSKR